MRASSKRLLATPLVLAAILFGCAATGPPPSVPAATDAGTPSGSSSIGPPLVLDRADDFRLGTTVQFSRIPTANELHDLQQVSGLVHVLLTLPSWPSSYAELEGLRNLPPVADLMVVLPGYPPTREAAEAWNLAEVRQRLIMVATGPPPTPATVGDLNAMRGLERVVVQTDLPSRAGFERLQRPISFRVLRD